MNSNPNAATNPALVKPAERFYEIVTNFNRVLQEVQRNSLARSNEAYTGFLTTLYGTQQESQKQLQDVVRTYQSSAQEAATRTDGTRQHEQAYRNYVDMLNGAYDEVRKRNQEAVGSCAASLQQARDEAQSQAVEAYRTYLQSLKEVWADLDVNAIVSATVARGQSC